MPKKQTKEKTGVPSKLPGNQMVPINEIPGLEGIDNEMLIIPRIKLVQGLSVEVSEGICAPGALVNSITKDILAAKGESLEIVPLMISRSRLKFQSMDDGGGLLCRSNDGFEGIGDPGGNCLTCPARNWGADKTPPECTEILNVAVMPLGEFIGTPLILSFGKTSFNVGKMFINMMATKKVSPWFLKYQLSTKFIEDKKGKYFVYKVLPDGDAPADFAEMMETQYKILKTTEYEIHSDEAEMHEEAENAIQNENSKRNPGQGEDDPF